MASTDDRDAADAIDLTTRVRRRVFPTLHRIKEPLGGFAQCLQHPDEYVGTIPYGLGEFRSDLQEMSFEPEPIAALKVHRDGRLSAGSWVRRQSALASWQLHVSLFRTDADAVEVFAHREYSWLRHSYKHYTGAGWDTEAGVERMRSLLSDHDVTYRIDPRRAGTTDSIAGGD
ncbi:hypothetical protein [Haloterrigena alkaliphila]|uniref:Uncharacterized protein n=1 Tax=Haloterrigena alkaliphila TaxID=2816475 RepID=A0A8A2V8W4_9EURY|nr:hypothetical protein [Haloterrigena alkaliphila]QSW97891.1 hypothetical protein J0X25_10720 [Haloterrigena alkaliphila]